MGTVLQVVDHALPARQRARRREVLSAIAETRGADPAPRLARRWIGELIELGDAIDAVPGVRRWTASALIGERARAQ